jgi:TPR repeat protein
MNSTRLLSALVAAVVILSMHGADQKARRTAKVKGEFDRGFDLFNGYSNPTTDRVEGWRIMCEAAKSGSLREKIDVADFASGHIAVNAEEDHRKFFQADLPLALEYYREGADAGNAHAKTELALLYSSGIGEPRNVSEKPQALLQSAAEQGHREAMMLLAERYLYGYGVRHDLLAAAHWHFEGSKDERFGSNFIDADGHPKLQDTALLDEFARIYSLYYRANVFKDKAARARLDELSARR